MAASDPFEYGTNPILIVFEAVWWYIDGIAEDGPMGMTKYDRLLHILNLLRARRNMTAGRLAVECGVTERSIYRDILALSEANIPIYYDNGYKLASDSFLPPLNFDYDEYQFLKTATESTPLRTTDKYGAMAKRVQAKIEACLSDAVRKHSRFTPVAMHVDIPMTLEQERSELFYGDIEEAATNSRCLRISYDSIESGQTERVVEPYFIIFRGRAFYFVAYCRLRSQVRTFRLDRVSEVQPTEELFRRREDICAETYFDGSWRVFSGEPVKVVIRFSGAAARVVSMGNHHSDELIESADDGTIVYTVTCRGLQEIQRWILGFGREAEVIAPDELRNELAAIGAYLRDTYDA
ncbi:MAG: YafY family transcriptional regulator [candidate division Zixibacteria bacterium]|nr:YafY family transcriptional regulator [candidate division Zixibacteria bacterium]MDH3939230.1 YafY family transcriptional regulator [candidate division Zixibacteria bacterium]MDH4034243.1 YafY family transcriptional regulator [candidate division Zixibacteria bacterium]